MSDARTSLHLALEPDCLSWHTLLWSLDEQRAYGNDHKLLGTFAKQGIKDATRLKKRHKPLV